MTGEISYSWKDLLQHEPSEVYVPAKSETEHCNFCKAPVTATWHGIPIFDTKAWNAVQAKFFEVNSRTQTIQGQMREYKISVNPELMAVDRMQKLLTRISMKLFTPEEIVLMEVEILTEILDELEQSFAQVRSQVAAPSLHLVQPPSKIIIPGRN